MKTVRLVLMAALLCGVGCSDNKPKTSVPSGDGDHPSGDGDSDMDSGTHPILDGGDGDGDFTGKDGGDQCGKTLKAVIRDFSTPDDGSTTDFENDAFENEDDNPTLGIVKDKLGADKKPVWASNGIGRDQVISEESYNQWYHDDTSGPNQRFDGTFNYDIVLKENPTKPGTYVFDTDGFFPIDGKGFADSELADIGGNHNFWFTTEIHTKFMYGGGEVFTFNGDDDVWLFINGHLAIDLGGLHPKALKTVDLNASASALGITTGNIYTMDIFHAERHTDSSTFHIETTIGCLIPVVL